MSRRTAPARPPRLTLLGHARRLRGRLLAPIGQRLMTVVGRVPAAALLLGTWAALLGVLTSVLWNALLVPFLGLPAIGFPVAFAIALSASLAARSCGCLMLMLGTTALIPALSVVGPLLGLPAVTPTQIAGMAIVWLLIGAASTDDSHQGECDRSD